MTMHRELREPPVILRSTDDVEMRDAPPKKTSSNDEIVLTPTRQFWRRLFRASPSASAASSPSGARRFKRKNRHNRDGDDEKSQSSSGSSSQSGSDDSEQSPKPNREHRLAKYLQVDTFTQPISLIANDGDLTFHRSSSGARDDNNDYDDYYDEQSNADDCRDDIHLLHDSSVVFQSHLLYTPKAFREPAEEEDRVALLSEHDDLLESRRGSYNVDCVDPLSLAEPAALQRLSLLTLKQELAAKEETFKFHMDRILPQQKSQGSFEVLLQPPQNNEPEVIPLQISFPSGETRDGFASPKSRISPHRFSNKGLKSQSMASHKKTSCSTSTSHGFRGLLIQLESPG